MADCECETDLEQNLTDLEYIAGEIETHRETLTTHDTAIRHLNEQLNESLEELKVLHEDCNLLDEEILEDISDPQLPCTDVIRHYDIQARATRIQEKAEEMKSAMEEIEGLRNIIAEEEKGKKTAHDELYEWVWRLQGEIDGSLDERGRWYGPVEKRDTRESKKFTPPGGKKRKAYGHQKQHGSNKKQYTGKSGEQYAGVNKKRKQKQKQKMKQEKN